MKNDTPHVTVSFKWLVPIMIFCLCAGGALAQPASKAANSHAQSAARVDVNSASLQTLETLPGVGPAVAKRIEEGRPYNSLQDLEKVKGLGKARIEAMRDKVIFGPANESTTEPTSRPRGTVSTSSASKKIAPAQPLNINTASVQDLEKLPDIGPVKAQAIVDYRAQNGPFKSPEDIQKVRGIKAGIFSKIRDYIKVTD